MTDTPTDLLWWIRRCSDCGHTRSAHDDGGSGRCGESLVAYFVAPSNTAMLSCGCPAFATRVQVANADRGMPTAVTESDPTLFRYRRVRSSGGAVLHEGSYDGVTWHPNGARANGIYIDADTPLPVSQPGVDPSSPTVMPAVPLHLLTDYFDATASTNLPLTDPDNWRHLINTRNALARWCVDHGVFPTASPSTVPHPGPVSQPGLDAARWTPNPPAEGPGHLADAWEATVTIRRNLADGSPAYTSTTSATHTDPNRAVAQAWNDMPAPPDLGTPR